MNCRSCGRPLEKEQLLSSLSTVLNSKDRKSKDDTKESKKLKKKSRTPDAKQKASRTTNQPLLESRREKEEELKNKLDELCEQCLVAINQNGDKNNNEDSINKLNQSDQLVLECSLEHNLDQLNCGRTSLKSNFDKFKLNSNSNQKQKIKNNNRSMNLEIAQQFSKPLPNKKISHSSIRDRKASITLGVIMCAFIL